GRAAVGADEHRRVRARDDGVLLDVHAEDVGGRDLLDTRQLRGGGSRGGEQDQREEGEEGRVLLLHWGSERTRRAVHCGRSTRISPERAVRTRLEPRSIHPTLSGSAWAEVGPPATTSVLRNQKAEGEPCSV